MEKQKLETDIVIHPQYYGSDSFYNEILQILKKMEMTCNKKDGYIDQIYQILDISSIKLFDNGYCKLHITYQASHFKPEINKKIKTTVQIIFEHGIFSSLYVLRFLIPISNLIEYIYIPNVGYKHKKTSHVISIGSEITIFITHLKYEKEHFSCIAELVE